MNFLERQLKDPVRFSRLKRGFYLALAAAAVAEIVTPLLSETHSHFRFEDFPAWGSLYGLVSCVVIIVVSKFLGKVWLMKREDYYDS